MKWIEINHDYLHAGQKHWRGELRYLGEEDADYLIANGIACLQGADAVQRTPQTYVLTPADGFIGTAARN